ncbi:UBP43 hydrolase, partial [Sterrhoptilus dennistouni]|nr:UBP43 hydrolase [Sterrhoptilus dennistouni]
QNTVSKHGSQFRGNAQHDALEFLLWLLDRMHEDLGAASPAQQGRGPAQVGGSAGWGCSGWGWGTPGCGARRWDGASSLTCPHCLKQSNTFDPFLCISLPIPLRQTRALNVTLVLQCERWRFGVDPLIGIGGAVCCDWSEAAAPHQDWGRQSLLGLVGNGSIWLGSVGAGMLRWCPRSLPTSPAAPRPEGPRLLPSTARSSDCLHRASGGRILLLLCNTAGTGPQLARYLSPACHPALPIHHLCDTQPRVPAACPRFGPPLVLREERGVSWEQLQQNILAQLRGVLRGEVRPQGSGALFRIRLAGGSAPCTYLSPQDPRPLCHPAIDRALQLSGAGGPPHVRLTVEWDTSTKERLFGSIQEEAVQDAESVRRQQQAHGQQHSCTLDECFQLYTKEEQVRA